MIDERKKERLREMMLARSVHMIQQHNAQPHFTGATLSLQLVVLRRTNPQQMKREAKRKGQKFLFFHCEFVQCEVLRVTVLMFHCLEKEKYTRRIGKEKESFDEKSK